MSKTKDNKKNLNNALSDDEMEAVAGGGEKDWENCPIRTFRNSVKEVGYSDEVLQSIFNNSTHQSALESMEYNYNGGRVTDEQLAKGRKILG